MKLYCFVVVGFEVVIMCRLREYSVPGLFRGSQTDQNILSNCMYSHIAFPAAAAISCSCSVSVTRIDLLFPLLFRGGKENKRTELP
jgi:hypothetical protein